MFSLNKNGIRIIKMLSSSIGFGVGIIFLVSGIQKASNSVLFLAQLYQYNLFNGDFAIAIAMILPWLECVLGVALISGFLRSGSLAITACLGLGFLFVQFWAIYQSLDISCACFGIGHDRQVGVNSLLLAAGVAIGSIFAYWGHRWASP